MKKKRIALALAAVMACGTMTACTPQEMMIGAMVAGTVMVPTSLGYAKKSKIQSANADAKTLMTCVNMVFAEMDEEGITITLNGWYDNNDENVSSDAQFQDVIERINYYTNAVENLDYSVCISNGACVSVVATNGSYFGIYPGYMSKNDYTEKLGKNPDFDDAKAVAEDFMNY